MKRHRLLTALLIVLLAAGAGWWVLAPSPQVTASEQVFEVLRDIVEKHGKTVVAVTHDLGLAARMDRHVELLDGRIVGDEQHQINAVT